MNLLEHVNINIKKVYQKSVVLCLEEFQFQFIIKNEKCCSKPKKQNKKTIRYEKFFLVSTFESFLESPFIFLYNILSKQNINK